MEAKANINSWFSTTTFYRCGLMQLINDKKHYWVKFDTNCDHTDADFIPLTETT